MDKFKLLLHNIEMSISLFLLKNSIKSHQKLAENKASFVSKVVYGDFRFNKETLRAMLPDISEKLRFRSGFFDSMAKNVFAEIVYHINQTDKELKMFETKSVNLKYFFQEPGIDFSNMTVAMTPKLVLITNPTKK